MSEIVNEYKLESYKKIKPLGEKGNLWIVEDSVTGKYFVMRKLSMDVQKVYQILTGIHHPNIVEITDVFFCSGFLYVIEEYLKGRLLSDVVAEKSISGRHVLSIGKQILNALSILHEHNIVHRDVKPENIMVDRKGCVKLIDFDIARLFSEDKSRDTTVKGSKDYASPEQFGFMQSDCRTDIYALGVTLNELATGELPEKKICRGRLGAVVRRCIEFDPKRRYQTAAQALKDIRRREGMVHGVCITVFAIFLVAMVIAAFSLQNPPVQTFDKLAESTEYRHRIIYVREPERYPAVLLEENQEYEFAVDLGNGCHTTVSAKHTQEQLKFSCLSPDGNKAEFEFDDVFSDWYDSLGFSINIDIQETLPEYEILLDDIDADGTKEFLITLAWRHGVDTLEPEMRYYLTEYSILWVVCQDGQGAFVCSEPLGFEGCLPSLENDTILYERMNTIWYSFDKENRTWLSLY